jgi:Flp pilus assembly protein TadD
MRLTIATVFRERSRGLVTPPNAARVGDRVEVPASLQLNALLEQALSRVAARDTDGARTAARKAVAISANARDPASAEAMNELAAVLIGSRDYADAEILLRRAQTSATGVTAVRVANNLAAVAALRGDVATAESLYRAALTMAGTVPEYEAARRSIEKNRQDLRPVR